jgi:hypothetical protein
VWLGAVVHLKVSLQTGGILVSQHTWLHPTQKCHSISRSPTFWQPMLHVCTARPRPQPTGSPARQDLTPPCSGRQGHSSAASTSSSVSLWWIAKEAVAGEATAGRPTYRTRCCPPPAAAAGQQAEGGAAGRRLDPPRHPNSMPALLHYAKEDRRGPEHALKCWATIMAMTVKIWQRCEKRAKKLGAHKQQRGSPGGPHGPTLPSSTLPAAPGCCKPLLGGSTRLADPHCRPRVAAAGGGQDRGDGVCLGARGGGLRFQLHRASR